MNRFLSKLCLLSFVLVSCASASFTTKSKQALLVDLTTGTILYDKNSDVLVPPSSMSKIMTVYVVFNEIKNGRLSLKDKFKVSKKAWRMKGSRMFINVASYVTVEDLLRGVITQSGNDAAVTLAEGISGTEEDFVQLMSRVAKRIGVRHSTFVNATGWPNPEHQMTLRDIAVIATRTMMDFPDLYHLYKDKEFTYNNIRQSNRNPLIHMDIGCDGLKTGHTNAGGYGLVASTIQKGRRLLVVTNGNKTLGMRSRESKRLINYGYRAFASTVLYSAGETVEVADVWMGGKDQIPLVSPSDIAITVPRGLIKDIRAEIIYKTPLQAPIQAGDALAKVVISIPGKEPKEYPLIAGESSKKLGFFSRIGSTINFLIFGAASSKKDSKVIKKSLKHAR